MNKEFLSDFLINLNKDLFLLEDAILKSLVLEEMPNIFVVGLPRSGTTIITQLLFNNLDIACTNNLMARFWDTPLVGAMLSKEVVGLQKSMEFESNYGRTSAIESPHEFSKFWRNFLNYNNPYDFNPKGIENTINWDLLHKKVIGLNSIFERPLVHKTLEYTTFFQNQFHNLFKRGIFIYIKRKPLDIAKSIYFSRLNNNNSLTQWWSSVPIEYKEIKDLSFPEQIAGQIYYLQRHINKSLAEIDSRFYIEIDYDELIGQPNQFLNTIVSRVNDMFGYKIEKLYTPRPYSKKIKSIDENVQDMLISALRKYNLYEE